MRYWELSERAVVPELARNLTVLPKLITMQQSCPLRCFSGLMAKLDLLYKCIENCQNSALLTKEATEMWLRIDVSLIILHFTSPHNKTYDQSSGKAHPGKKDWIKTEYHWFYEVQLLLQASFWFSLKDEVL